MLHIKSRVSRNYIIIVMMLMSSFIGAKDNPKWVKEKIDQIKMGNFALPVSQQPGPLLAFGQNVIEKGDLQAFLYGDLFKGTQQSFAEIHPSVLYGINDKCSLFVVLPIAISFKSEQFKSQGLRDLIIQMEGVVFAKETPSSVNEITLLGNVGVPTGSLCKNPTTGYGSPTIFCGLTASHTNVSWYYFTSVGGVLTTPHNNIKFGNQFLYQFGVSRNISYKTDNWIVNWMVELDGIYTQRNKISGIVDCNSGGNILLLGPSLFFSTRRFILQGGASAVIAEHLFGVQHKDKYTVAAYAGWKF